jgi:acetyl-CoA acetyltransferase
MRGQAVIAGIGHTAFGKLPGRSTVSLNIEACRNALADCGLSPQDVDALFVKVPTSKVEMMYGQKLAEAMGLAPRVGGVWDQGGASNVSMIAFAAMAIEAGQCELALVTLADNPRTGTRQAYEKAWGDDAVFGWFSVVASYAMIARRHMHDFGTRPEHLAAVAIACRKPRQRQPPRTAAPPADPRAYMDAPWVVEPLRRDDCCLISDGAAAVVVMSAKRARRLQVKAPVPGTRLRSGSHLFRRARCAMTSRRPWRAARPRTAFKMAGLGPEHIDVAQIYDCFTITVLMTLQAYGLIPPKQATISPTQAPSRPEDACPSTPQADYSRRPGCPGMQLVIEGVRQMRGTSVNQVRGARTCIVSNQGGIMHTHSTLILANEGTP